ncbi:PAS domain S-box protein [Desulfobotulus mexicanus]|uniref:PAS domain S-box protein n=1 Tax=Desulfobotulus mexicanus TaxID=2586642 RepID=A0A5Q4VCP2_9BACT|nr:PAS domain S-box protein [Desulfobotulus mexicanus]TYT75335.1 PAS domain S-box protein [Desulfobotulus mexicanus]
MSSQKEFEVFFRNNPSMMTLSGLWERKYTDVNEAFLKVLGYERDEVLGRSASVLGLFQNRDLHHTIYETVVKQSCIYDIEVLLNHKNGKLIKAALSAEQFTIQALPHILTVITPLEMPLHNRFGLHTRSLPSYEIKPLIWNPNILGSMGDTEMAQRILQSFLKQIPERIHTLKTAMEKRDLASAQKEAQRIKAASFNVGAEALWQTVCGIEKKLLTNDANEAMEDLSFLENGYSSLMKIFETQISGFY